MHKDTETANFIKITTEKGSFIASDFHNIRLINSTFAFTKNLNGQFLENGQKVIELASITKEGIYAPLTESSNFYIHLGNNEKTLAHSYAYLPNPEFYEPMVNLIIGGWELMYGSS